MQGTILIAEDESLPRRNICQLLEEEGYRVYEAADGKSALEIVDNVDLDLEYLLGQTNSRTSFMARSQACQGENSPRS